MHAAKTLGPSWRAGARKGDTSEDAASSPLVWQETPGPGGRPFRLGAPSGRALSPKVRDGKSGTLLPRRVLSEYLSRRKGKPQVQRLIPSF